MFDNIVLSNISEKVNPMNENRVPTYGAVVSSMDYDIKIRRRQWLKKNKNNLIVGSVLLLLATLAAVIITLI